METRGVLMLSRGVMRWFQTTFGLNRTYQSFVNKAQGFDFQNTGIRSTTKWLFQPLVGMMVCSLSFGPWLVGISAPLFWPIISLRWKLMQNVMSRRAHFGEIEPVVAKISLLIRTAMFCGLMHTILYSFNSCTYHSNPPPVLVAMNIFLCSSCVGSF